MFTKLLVTFCWLNSVSSFKRTNIKFNQNTRGYEDIVIVVSEELSAASCPQILDNVKVCTDHFSILGPGSRQAIFIWNCPSHPLVDLWSSLIRANESYSWIQALVFEPPNTNRFLISQHGQAPGKNRLNRDLYLLLFPCLVTEIKLFCQNNKSRQMAEAISQELVSNQLYLELWTRVIFYNQKKLFLIRQLGSNLTYY